MNTDRMDHFSHAISALQTRTERLLRQSRIAGTDSTVVLTELSNAIEELTVAEEELNVQGAELVVARAVAEAAERRYRELFEAAPDAYVITDSDGMIIEANDRAAALFCVPLWTLAGKPLATFVALHERRTFRSLMVRLAQGTAVSALEVTLDLREGGTVPAEVSVTVGSDGSWRWLIRDVTERKRLERAAVEAGDRERRRIGQELHDDLGQQLTGVLLLGEVLRQELAAEGSPHAARAARMVALMRNAIQSTRELSHGLASVTVPPQELDGALAELADKVDANPGIECRFRTAGDGVLTDAAVATHVFRIAQEAVTNVLRHANATVVRIELVIGVEAGVLRVVDDGQGVPPEEEEGLGIRSMRLRAGYIGATLEVSRPPDGGTSVECHFPV